MSLRNKLFLFIASFIFSFSAPAQDVSVVLADFGCNICAGGYGGALSMIAQTPKRKLTLIVRSEEYYGQEQAEELLRQRLNMKASFDVIISDSLVSVLIKAAPVKYKKDMGGYVFVQSDGRYDYFSPLSELGIKVDMLNLLDTYKISHEKVYTKANKESRRAFLSCPICTHAVIDSSMFVLSIYAGTMSAFEGVYDTASTVYAMNQPGPLFSKLYSDMIGDTFGSAQFLASASFSPFIPIGLQVLSHDDVRIGVSYYTVKRDSAGNAAMGEGRDGIIHVRLSDGSVKLYPINPEGIPAVIQHAGWITLNDSQIIFQFSELNGRARTGKPLFGLFQYQGNEIVFKRELTELVLPKTKADLGFISYYKNKYALVPVSGEAVNCHDLKDVYKLDYKKIASFVKLKFKAEILPSKAWWMDYVSIDPRICRVIFSYEDRLYILFINKKTSEVITGQTMQEQSIADRASATKMYRDSIYYITKSGSVSRIRLD
jgi:hypothetical protein